MQLWSGSIKIGEVGSL